MRNVFATNPLLLILAALALIDNDITMAVLVYKRIAAQPFQIAFAQTEKLVQFRRFTAVTTTLTSAAFKLTGCTNRLANIFDGDARRFANRYQIVMNR